MRMVDDSVVQKVKMAFYSLQRFQWEQGCLAQALLEYDGYSAEIVQVCKSTIVRNYKDGRIGMMEKNEAVDDPAAIGEALVVSAQTTKDPELKTAADKLYFYLKYRAPKTTDGIIYHFNIKNEVWVDAYYMAPPFLCKYGDIDEAMKQIKGFRKYLFDEKACLLSHIWDDDIHDFGRKAFWGVGNGWAAAGLTRVLAMLPDDRQEDKQYLIDYIQKLVDGAVRWQREDGLYHDVLNDPDSFVETNVGQMIAYTIYRGVARGNLDSKYLTYADKARDAAYAKVDEYGFVQGVCGIPDFLRSSIAPEGQAFFILMEAAARDLYEKK